jgi:hypothetical protein
VKSFTIVSLALQLYPVSSSLLRYSNEVNSMLILNSDGLAQEPSFVGLAGLSVELGPGDEVEVEVEVELCLGFGDVFASPRGEPPIGNTTPWETKK